MFTRESSNVSIFNFSYIIILSINIERKHESFIIAISGKTGSLYAGLIPIT